MKAEERLRPSVIKQIEKKIEENDGCEVLFCGLVDEEGMVFEIITVASGHETATVAPTSYMKDADVVIHNHPSGQLRPSNADLSIASLLGRDGIGSYIIDNHVKNLVVVVEPYQAAQRVEVDSGSLVDFCESQEGFSKYMGDYEYRESQLQMMKGVANALNQNEIYIVEAGTGIGKSLAYLIPAIKWAMENKSRGGDRIVISTATINLQDQLIQKDLPMAMKILNSDVKYVLMKGRNNYLCRRRFDEEASLGNSLFEEEIDWSSIRDWSLQTATGDFNELTFPLEGTVKSRICSESDNCLAIQCPFYDKCFVFNLRKEAASSQIIVVNNHLLFADTALRMDSASDEGTMLIPSYTKVIFDEAHNIEKDATRYFTQTLSSVAVRRVMGRIKSKRGTRVFGLLTQLKKFHMVSASSLEELNLLQEEALSTMIELDEELLVKSQLSEGKIRSLGVTKDAPLPNYVSQGLLSFHRCCEKISLILTRIIDDLEKEYPNGEGDSAIREIALSVRRIDSLLEPATRFLDFIKDSESIYWLSKEKRLNGEPFVQFNITPMEIGPLLEQSIWSTIETAVCASATLAIDSHFDYFLQSIGLEQSQKERLKTALFHSPFDYKERILLAVSDKEAPGVSDSPQEFIQYAIEFTRNYLLASQGRALLLFTSLSQMNAVYEGVEEDLQAAGITALRQGGESRVLLLERFKKDIGSVLFATDSFWEGVDAPGKTLEHLLMFRLPFRVPDDPVLQARSQRVEENGGRSFFDISIPQAVMRFKQGFGRVMRKKSDCGVIVILDNRVVTKNYGTLFIKSIPATSRVSGSPQKIIDTAQRFMERLGT